MERDVYCSIVVLLSTKSIPNYSSFDFFTLSLTTHLIQKFMLNITSFVVVFFINKSSSKIT